MGSTSKKINGVAKKECMRGKVSWKTQGLQTQKVKIAPKHTKYSEENYWKGNTNKTVTRNLK